MIRLLLRQVIIDDGLNDLTQERIPKGSEGFLRHCPAAGTRSDGEDGGDVG